MLRNTQFVSPAIKVSPPFAATTEASIQQWRLFFEGDGNIRKQEMSGDFQSVHPMNK